MMFYNFLVTVITIIVIPIAYVINTIFRSCVHSKKANFYFNYFIYYFIYFLSCILSLPALVLRIGDTSNAGAFSHISNFIGYLIGIKVTVRNAEELAIDRAAVVMQNHQSSFDLLIHLMIWNIPKKLIGISKREIQYFFPLGLASYLNGGFLLSRNNKTRALAELEVVKADVVKKKAKAWFFPEGTRNRNRETFLPFKKGSFHVAVGTQVPIIPVVASPFHFLDYETPSFEKGEVILQVLEAIPTTGLTADDIPELMKTVHSRMWAEYKKLYAEVMPKGPLASKCS